MNEPDLVDDEAIDRMLQASAVFGRLDAEARDLLRKELTLRVALRGDVLMRAGDEADGLYLLGSGRVQVIFVNDDGSEVVVNELGRGELIGEMALITDRPRSATIVAMRDSHLLFLSTEAFTRVVRAHPDALRAVSSALIERLDAQLRDTARQASPATSLVIVPLDDERTRPRARTAAFRRRWSQ